MNNLKTAFHFHNTLKCKFLGFCSEFGNISTFNYSVGTIGNVVTLDTCPENCEAWQKLNFLT